jgi:hypothetical protein
MVVIKEFAYRKEKTKSCSETLLIVYIKCNGKLSRQNVISRQLRNRSFFGNKRLFSSKYRSASHRKLRKISFVDNRGPMF